MGRINISADDVRALDLPLRMYERGKIDFDKWSECVRAWVDGDRELWRLLPISNGDWLERSFAKVNSFTTEQAAEAAGCTYQTAAAALTRLLRQQRAVRIAPGLWKIGQHPKQRRRSLPPASSEPTGLEATGSDDEPS